MDDRIIQAAADGALILTVNDRLSRHLQQEYDACQQRLGVEVWLRPEILSVSTWLMHCQRRFLGGLTVLNNAQLQNLWESIIEKDIKAADVELLHVRQTAKRALQAHQLLLSYEADFGSEEASEDHRAFLRWRKAWQTISSERGWHDRAALPRLLAKHLAEHQVTFAAAVVFAGFDEITPDLERLVKTLQTAGHQIDFWHPQPCQKVLMQRFQAADAIDEISQCARWARNILDQNSSARIGVVVPQLEAYRSSIERGFAAELEPSATMAADEEVGAFNLSLGKALDAEEVVGAAVRLLRPDFQVEQKDLSWLLHTPYIAGAESEALVRAKLDRELLGLRRPLWTVARLPGTIRGLSDRYSLNAPAFIKVLNGIAAEIKTARKRLPGEWAEHFVTFLQKLGWPGEKGLSSREYQAVNSFKNVLAEFASLDRLGSQLSRVEAVELLAGQVSETPFQPEGKNAPVQVLGELESAGLAFDHLWILGLHDRALPGTPSPNPFIPLPVQRRYEMKRSNAEREHRFAEQIVRRLFSAAPDVILSWPAQEEGAPLRKSPFIPDGLPEYQRCETSCTPRALISASPVSFQVLADRQGPPLPPRRTFSGGTGILKDQALCPFRAFAHYRLRAEQADSADIGIDNMSRGTLAHTALELFWGKVKDRQSLLALDEKSFADLMAEAVESALDSLERENRQDIPARQRQIETMRLCSLVKAWLLIEKQRPDFTVLAAEKGQQIAIGDLVIRTRIDRIDRLADERMAIIDYKTGMPDPSQWLDARITEPQLPVYCLAMPREQLGAVMFGVVRAKEKERGFKGLARDIEAWPGASSKTIERRLEEQGLETFDAIIEHWHNALQDVGDAFASGRADIDPIDYERACKYCDLKRLCRVSEKHAGWQENDDE